MIITTVIIMFSYVYIIEFSGIIPSLSSFIYKRILKEKWIGQLITAPFGCAKCMTFWTVLIYWLIYSGFILAILVACTAALLISVLVNILKMYFKFINKWGGKIDE